MSIINRHTHYSISAQSQANTLVIATSEDKVHIKASELFREIQKAMGRKYVIQFQETATTGTMQDRIQKMVDVVLNGYKEKHSFLTNVVVNAVANWWCKLWGTSSEWSKIRSQANDILTSVSNYAPILTDAPIRSESSKLEESFSAETESLQKMLRRFPMRMDGLIYESTATSPLPATSAIRDLLTQPDYEQFFDIATKGDGKLQCWIDSGVIDLLPILLFGPRCDPNYFQLVCTRNVRGIYNYFDDALCVVSHPLDIVGMIKKGLAPLSSSNSAETARPYVNVIILALAAAKQCKKSEILETDFSLWEKNKRMDTVTEDEILALKREDFTKDPMKILKVAILMVRFLHKFIDSSASSDPDRTISSGFLTCIRPYQINEQKGSGPGVLSDQFFNSGVSLRQLVIVLIMVFYKLAKEE